MDSKTVIIIQCRYRSSRLPGKALLPIANKMTILEFLIRRLKNVRNVQEVVLTTGEHHSNSKICEIANNIGIKVFRGPEDDVLGRFVNAANMTFADNIVRVCADNPLTDPGLIEDLLDYYFKNNIEHLSTFENPSVPYGSGCAIFSKNILDLADKSCDSNDISREHVEPFFLESENINTVFYKDNSGRHYPDLRLSVDTKENYDFVHPIVENLYLRKGLEFSIHDVIKISKKPKIALFANGKLGLMISNFLKENNLEVSLLVLHPDNESSLKKEIIDCVNISSSQIIDHTDIEKIGLSFFKKNEFDICLSIWSSYIFEKDLINTFPLGVFNLHNSLLPSLRGSGANIWAIKKNIPTGVSFHRIIPSIDLGPIIEQTEMSVSLEDTGYSLLERQYVKMRDILKDRWSDIVIGNYDYIRPFMKSSYFSKQDRDNDKVIDLYKDCKPIDLINNIRAYQFGDYDSAFFYDSKGNKYSIRVNIKLIKKA